MKSEFCIAESMVFLNNKISDTCRIIGPFAKQWCLYILCLMTVGIRHRGPLHMTIY